MIARILIILTLTGCGRPQAIDAEFTGYLENYSTFDTDEISILFSNEETQCPAIRIDYILWSAIEDRDRLVICKLERCLEVPYVQTAYKNCDLSGY